MNKLNDKISAETVRKRLAKYLKSENITLKGINVPDARVALVNQIVCSYRMVKKCQSIVTETLDPEMLDINNINFDPRKKAVAFMKNNEIDEAVWLIFLQTAFGKHEPGKNEKKGDGWQLLKSVYGSFRGEQVWTFKRFRSNSDEFYSILNEKWEPSKVGRNARHRIRVPKNPAAICKILKSFLKFQPFESFTDKLESVYEKVGRNPKKVFDELYNDCYVIHYFGRLACFDFLVMLGHLEIIAIDPGSVYLRGATGPLKGANLLFHNDKTIECSVRELKDLEDKVNKLDCFLKIGKHALEDSLCIWQEHVKSTANEFKGKRILSTKSRVSC